VAECCQHDDEFRNAAMTYPDNSLAVHE